MVSPHEEGRRMPVGQTATLSNWKSECRTLQPSKHQKTSKCFSLPNTFEPLCHKTISGAYWQLFKAKWVKTIIQYCGNIVCLGKLYVHNPPSFHSVYYLCLRLLVFVYQLRHRFTKKCFVCCKHLWLCVCFSHYFGP